MRKIFVFALIFMGVVCTDANAAVASRSSARTRGGASGQSVTTQSANSAVTTGTVRRAARAAVSQPTQNTTKKVNARAATTQKVVNSGTKIVSATTNTVVSEECKTKYYGCMDSFCMLDNANGGRCLCSNRHTELDEVLDEIQKLDEQSYAMATTGVERINMGADADAVQSMVDKITGDIQNSNTKNTRARTLNLDAWNNIYETDEMDVFGDTVVDIANQTGDALHASVSDMCVKQMPECSREISMLKLMYGQQIKSDCTAYENSLKQQKNASVKKLQTAQQALREAALEQHQNANKYDLGQCTIRFKQCMQTTAGCGEDFANCASVVAIENAQTRVGTKSKSKTYTIKTGVTSISIAASTYDILTSKKPMCDTVTNQCTLVRNQVWDTFLREVAPELKSAELVAESNVRMNCIGNISECFQKACKDTMDPNDPDGSYDMCLSRPETVRSLCKVQIDPCVAAEPQILDYVYARLASIRVDACTTEVKECLQSDDRCGSDYSQCIGLDTDTIVNLCPSDKLTACNVDKTGQKLEQSAVYDNIENIISGIMLNIDNSMLTTCQNAVNESMVKVCGDTETCDNADFDLSSLKQELKVRVCPSESELKNDCYDSLSMIKDEVLRDKKFAAKVVSPLDTSKIKLNDDMSFVLETGNDVVTSKVVAIMNTSLNNMVKMLESDTKVQYCITGRQVQGRGDNKIGREKMARFPNLTAEYKAIIANGLFSKLSEKDNELMSSVLSKVAELDNEIAKRIYAYDEKKLDEENEKNCKSYLKNCSDDGGRCGLDNNDWRKSCPTDYAKDQSFENCKNNCKNTMSSPAGVSQLVNETAAYDSDTNVCTIVTTQFSCIDWHPSLFCKRFCEMYDTGTVINTKKIQMAKSN